MRRERRVPFMGETIKILEVSLKERANLRVSDIDGIQY
jgi:hypothetical protein